MDRDLRRDRIGGLPVHAGVVTGALAYVAGLSGAVVLYLVFGLGSLVDLGVPMVGRPGLPGAVFAFYGGHFVPTVAGGGTINFALEAASNGVAYVLLVGIVLASAGFYLGSAEGLDGPARRAAAGATLAVGYLPLATAGAVFVEYRATPTTPEGVEAGGFLAELPLARAVVVAGILVPMLYGAAGGAVATVRA